MLVAITLTVIVVRLRERGEIDDAVLTRMQSRLDIEELRLSPADADDRPGTTFFKETLGRPSLICQPT